MNWFRTCVSALEELIFPLSCVGCGRMGTVLCPACAQACSLSGLPSCVRCGAVLPTSQLTCHRCHSWPAELVAVRAPFRFGGPVRQAIHQLKYRGVRRAGFQLGQHLAAYAVTALPALFSCQPVAVVPIPLHPSRQRERGFNQAALLAQPVAEALGVPVVHGLVRQRATQSQVGQSHAARQANVAGAFAWQAEQPAPATVVLVDDVITTGATLIAACEPLRAASVQQVIGLSLARHLLDV